MAGHEGSTRRGNRRLAPWTRGCHGHPGTNPTRGLGCQPPGQELRPRPRPSRKNPTRALDRGTRICLVSAVPLLGTLFLRQRRSSATTRWRARDGRWRSRSWSHARPPRHRSWDQGDGGATPPRGGEVKNLAPQWSWTRRSWGNEGPAASSGRSGGPRRRVASGSGRDAEGGDKADAMRNRTRLNVIFST